MTIGSGIPCKSYIQMCLYICACFNCFVIYINWYFTFLLVFMSLMHNVGIWCWFSHMSVREFVRLNLLWDWLVTCYRVCFAANKRSDLCSLCVREDATCCKFCAFNFWSNYSALCINLTSGGNIWGLFAIVFWSYIKEIKTLPYIYWHCWVDIKKGLQLVTTHRRHGNSLSRDTPLKRDFSSSSCSIKEYLWIRATVLNYKPFLSVPHVRQYQDTEANSNH